MEEVKPKLDDEMQDILDCLGSGAEEDATKLYEAMKVSLSHVFLRADLVSHSKDVVLRGFRAQVTTNQKGLIFVQRRHQFGISHSSPVSDFDLK